MAKKTKSKFEMMLAQMGMGNVQFLETGLENNISFIDFFLQFQNDVMSMFKWKRLPDTVSERYLELQLFLTGHAIFFFADDGSRIPAYLCLGGALFDPNIYGDYVHRQPIAQNGQKFRMVDRYNSVIIYNNSTRSSSSITAERYAKKLYLVNRTIDVNLNTMKTPIIIRCNKKNQLALQEMMLKYDGNQPLIYVDEEQALNDNLEVLNMSIDPRLKDLTDLNDWVMAQGLTNQGIPIATSDKAERLLSNEIATNNAQNLLIANDKLKQRKQACEEINRLFGLDIDVEFSDTFKTFIENQEVSRYGDNPITEDTANVSY